MFDLTSWRSKMMTAISKQSPGRDAIAIGHFAALRDQTPRGISAAPGSIATAEGNSPSMSIGSSPVPAEPEPEPVRAVAAAGPLGPAVAAAAAPEHMRQGALAEVQRQALPYHGIARGEPVSRKRRTSGAPSLGYSWTRKILRSFFTEESNF
jgi:hypothetical protein